jgi:hypothetical protein
LLLLQIVLCGRINGNCRSQTQSRSRSENYFARGLVLFMVRLLERIEVLQRNERLDYGVGAAKAD